MAKTGIKVTVTDECTGCGVCVDECPHVFELQDGVAVVKPKANLRKNQACIESAAASCPTEAVVIS